MEGVFRRGDVGDGSGCVVSKPSFSDSNDIIDLVCEENSKMMVDCFEESGLYRTKSPLLETTEDNTNKRHDKNNGDILKMTDDVIVIYTEYKVDM